MDISEQAVRVIELSLAGARENNQVDTVALYLDESMEHVDADGQRNYLPVIAMEGRSFYAPFVPRVRDTIARYFGADFTAAQQLIDEINEELGLEPDEVIEMVGASMALAEKRRDGR